MKWILLNIIKIYQKTVSPDHGCIQNLYPYGYCRFSPSCSQYTYEAISQKGVLRGVWLGFKRVLKCNPWNNGGVDKVE